MNVFTALIKAFVILLLLCFSVQITGYHLYFHYRQIDMKRAVRKRIRRRVDPSMTEFMTFPITSDDKEAMPEWIGEYEFTFRGEMYDVLDKKIEGGQMIIRCLNDKKEKNLIDYYKSLTRKDFGEKSKKRTSLLLKLACNFYTSAVAMLTATSPNAGNQTGDMRRYSLAFVTCEVPTPPPQGY